MSLIDDLNQKAAELISALNDRNFRGTKKRPGAYILRDQILLRHDPKDWLRFENQSTQVTLILDALGRVLSHNCLYEPKTQICRFERINNILRARQPAIHSLTLEANAHLAMFQGFMAFHRRAFLEARHNFELVRVDAQRLQDVDLEAAAVCFIAGCARKMDKSKEALEHYSTAQALLNSLPDTAGQKRARVVDLYAAGEKFNLGEVSEVETLLEDIEEFFDVLATDPSALAHAHTLISRLDRRRGRYEHAKAALEKAVEEYGQLGGHFRALARTHYNLAHTNVLLAKRSVSPANKSALLTEAMQHLDCADEIYKKCHHGLGWKVEGDNIRAMIELERSNWEKAFNVAQLVYDKVENNLEQATARIIQVQALLSACAPKGVATEEKQAIEEEFALRAHRLAQDAVSVTGPDQPGENQRRRARATVWLGITLLRRPFSDPNGAAECLARAKQQFPAIATDEAGYLAEEWHQLEANVNSATAPSAEAYASAVYRVTMGEFFSSRSAEIVRSLEERMMARLIRDGLRYEDIGKAFGLSPQTIGNILSRCKEHGLLSEADLKRGPKPKVARNTA